ncbi:MAG TPA: TraB/GumN family protein [Caulobacteraceae bacterium]|jgi:hypothetical protein
MLRHWRSIRALVAGFLASIALSSAAVAAPALWIAKSPTATIYLFGTMHILEPETTWRTPSLDSAYAKATTIWFELDMSSLADPKVAADLVTRFGFDDAHPLSTKLDAEHLSALKAVLQHQGLAFDRIDRMRPWAAALALTALPMLQAGFDPKQGADMQLTSSAGADHKAIRAFETVDQQMHLFVDMSPATEIEFLDDTIDSNTKTNHTTQGIEAAWVSGDIQKLGQVLINAMKKRYPEFYENLIRRRNLAWSEMLTKELAGSGTELVNVGALHMVGDEGLPALLKAKGYSVERLQ